MMLSAPCIDDKAIAEIAEKLRADRRTIIRRIAGLPVRGRVAEDIDREIAIRLQHITK